MLRKPEVSIFDSRPIAHTDFSEKYKY